MWRHGVGADFVEMGVPDPDPVKGVLNMAEAAESFGLNDISMRVSSVTIPPVRHDELRAALGMVGKTEISVGEDHFIAHVVING